MKKMKIKKHFKESPLSKEAKHFTETQLLQRDVYVTIDTFDDKKKFFIWDYCLFRKLFSS